MRLCGLNPEIDYKPVQWALRESYPSTGTFWVWNSIEAESTVTAYESLREEDRAILILLNGVVAFDIFNNAWTIDFDFRHGRHRIEFTGSQPDVRKILGQAMDHRNQHEENRQRT